MKLKCNTGECDTQSSEAQDISIMRARFFKIPTGFPGAARAKVAGTVATKKPVRQPEDTFMSGIKGSARLLFSLVVVLTIGGLAVGQRQSESGFGPVVTAYLGYLNNEQEVVDDRASRREITSTYYRRNSNRIHALKEMAVKLARQSGNDYVPELEAVAVDEFRTIFERPPRANELRANEI